MSKQADKSKETPGDAMASAASFTRHVLGIGERMLGAERMFDKLFDEGINIDGIKLRAPDMESPQWLAVVTGRTGGEPVVAFHSEETFEETVSGVLKRLGNRSLKWREDTYRGIQE